MPLVTKTLPNLINGVSQQPDALRMDTQCTAQDNAYPSVVEGLTKRLPSEHVAKTNLTADAKTFVHTINRDSPEQYSVILRDQQIRVYDKDGTLKTVEMGANTGADNDNVTYLDTDNADKSLKALTIADVTYIVNSEIKTEMTGVTSPSTAPNEALVFISQAFESTYRVEITQNGVTRSAEVQAANSPSSGQVEVNASDIAEALSIQLDNIDVSAENKPEPGSFFGGMGPNPAQSFTVSSADPITGFRWKSGRDLRSFNLEWAIYSGAPFSTTSATAFHQNNRETSRVFRNGPDAGEIQEVTLPSFVPSVGTTYYLVCKNANGPAGSGSWVIFDVPAGWLAGGNDYANGSIYIGGSEDGFSSENPQTQPGSHDTTKDFYFQILQEDAGSSGTGIGSIQAEARGPVVYVSSGDSFSITSDNSYAPAYIDTFKGRAQKLSDLPNTAKDGMIFKVEGSVDAGVDDYYVRFVTTAESGALGKGTYEECAEPSLIDGLEPAPQTMPHLLIKQSNGTFVFKKADGENHTSGSDTFDYSAFKWGSRKVGDKLTNPDPSFIGKTINNLFLFKNRFGVLSDENIVMTEAGEFFNFFRTTVIDLLDTAPIDIASASSEVAILRHAVPLSEKLVLLSDSGQFILQSDTALSVKTVAIARSTAYNIIKDAEPSASENAVFFAFNRGSFSGVREYVPADVEDNFEAVDISAQVPKYIPGKITKIVAANHENAVFCLTDGDTDAIYVYNYYNGDRQRIQSAWHRWEIGTGAKILNIDLIDTDLFLTVQRAEGVFIEKMAIEVGKTDPSANYVARLDRRVSNTSPNVSVTGSQITMPYAESVGRDLEVITTAGQRIPVTNSADEGATAILTANQDMTGVSFFAGEAYTMSYTFSDIVLREPTQSGGLAIITDGRLQIRYGTLTFGESGAFNVDVTPDFRDTSNHTFTGRILGAGTMKLGSVPLESGEFRFPVFSKADQVAITLTNDTPLPCNLLSAEFELSWNPRSRRR